MRQLLLQDRVIDRAIDFTWGLMIPAFIYMILARWVILTLPGVITPGILCMVGAGAGTLYGLERYSGGMFQRIVAWPLSGVMFLFGMAGFWMLFSDTSWMSLRPMRLVDVAMAMITLWWGFYLFLSTAMRKRLLPTELAPGFMIDPR